MNSRVRAVLVAALALAVSAVAAAPAAAAHHPIYMPNLDNEHNSALAPPPVELPPVCVTSPATDVCVPYQVPPAGQPAPVNMAYFGGHVQTVPHIYLVFWGWGEKGAFSSKPPDGVTRPKGLPSDDPDGVAARMTSFVKALGGTSWAGTETQYYQLTGGRQQFITNPRTQLAGAWWDNTDPIHNNLSGLELAQEAQRAAAHFGVTNLANAQFVIAQPQNYNEAGFNNGAGYCAWHDYTTPEFYPGVRQGIAFTNMPYVLNQGFACGQDAVNPAPRGDLDGVTIVAGHEIEETVTDPGAEDTTTPGIGSGTVAGIGINDGHGIQPQGGTVAGQRVGGQNLGGWFDYSGYENGDKCAWVGDTGVTQPSLVPGGLNDIKGNDGRQYPVQSLWSNQAARGLGYCAGAGDDLGF
jgi:hypothetical protein